MRLSRAVIPVLGLAVFAALAVIEPRAPSVYLHILRVWGIDPIWPPFLDLHGVLSSVECYRLGVDVYNTNPCDFLSRPYNYSPLILGLAIFGVNGSWVLPGGIALMLLFLLALASLPQPTGIGGWTLTLLASFSTMTIFGLERCNGDIAIFLLVVLAGHLIAKRTGRIFGYSAAILAALLKFYPIALLLVSLRERRTFFLAINAAAAALIVLFVAAFHRELARAFDLVPIGSYFSDLFGAKNLSQGAAKLLSESYGLEAPGSMEIFRGIMLALLCLYCGFRSILVAATQGLRERFADLPRADAIFFCLGAAVILVCFFGAQNIGYRGIFLLLVLPGLLRLSHERNALGARIAWRSSILIVFLMWAEFVHHGFLNVAHSLQLSELTIGVAALVFWLVRELIWWTVIGSLAGFLLCFALDSEIGRMIERRCASAFGSRS